MGSKGFWRRAEEDPGWIAVVDPDGRRERLPDGRAQPTPDEVIVQRVKTRSDGGRLFESFGDAVHEGAHAGSGIGVVEVPRRQLGVEAVVAMAQCVQRPGGERQQRGRLQTERQVNRHICGRLGCVDPPARCRYHPADFPGAKEIAAAL